VSYAPTNALASDDDLAESDPTHSPGAPSTRSPGLLRRRLALLIHPSQLLDGLFRRLFRVILEALRRHERRLQTDLEGVAMEIRANHEILKLIAAASRIDRQGRLDYPSAEIYLNVRSKREQLRLRACAKEPWTVAWLEQAVQPNDVLYDIGANVGAYSLVAAIARQAQVVAFEPGYANYAALCDNIVLNNVGDKVTPVPFGLAATTGPSVFTYSDVLPGAAYHTLGDSNENASIAAAKTLMAVGSRVYRQPVLVYRLDDLIDVFKLPSPNHLKLDVDGSEVDVLEGAARVLEHPALRSVMVEVSVDQADAVVSLLTEHKLYLCQKIDRLSKGGELRFWYGLFTREPKAMALPSAEQWEQQADEIDEAAIGIEQ
jgi:FkbM family methyltransferase